MEEKGRGDKQGDLRGQICGENTFLFKRAVAPDIREGEEDSHAHKAMGLKAGQVACRNKRNEEKKKKYATNQ